MKKFLSWALALIFIGAGFVSCSNDDDVRLYYSYGTVMPYTQGENMQIRKDAGAYLTVHGWTGNLQVDDRVIVSYEVTGKFTEGGNNDVRLWGYEKILSKAPVRQTALNDGSANVTEEEMSNDGFTGLGPVWCSGQYLNIAFKMLYDKGSSQKHFINIVADDVNFDGETLTLTLRHNAYGDLPESGRYLSIVEGLVSFNLVQLYEEMDIDEEDYPEINVVWQHYENPSKNELTEKTIELDPLKPWSDSSNESKDMSNIARTSMSSLE